MDNIYYFLSVIELVVIWFLSLRVRILLLGKSNGVGFTHFMDVKGKDDAINSLDILISTGFHEIAVSQYLMI